ncbi:MAG: hypothetical protein A3I05_07925 [Deltaproteobacteria bacterium RIFCSPLOWO2_02_FULL_44_10]|nr:MAG: hypothetical protein A3C46_01775 [Deltaproteobacteria bacterium RIFCSPHIGHO2_02_FULL_44_16]OGQ45613.1 MAG: hypothetical protein A3I05_07925 [Deltaproteobacteria bacterium RIFCSPLOWO2_02_FULL_44_10]
MIRTLLMIFFVLLICFGAFYAGIIDIKTNTIEESSWQPKKAPSVVFERLDGSSLSLEAFHGKIILLNFWATWCPPCIEEFPALLEAVRHFNGEVVLIAVSNDASKKDISSFLKHFESYRDVLQSSSVEMVWDSHAQVSNDVFHVFKLPETFLIDKDFFLAKKFVGKVIWGEEFQKTLQSFLSEYN